MRNTYRLLVSSGLAVLVVVASGCGGPPDEAGSAQQPANSTTTTSSESYGVKSSPGTSSGASISATNAVYNGSTTVSFYPGSYMDQSLFVNFTCYQNGVAVLGAGSWELHYAVANSIGGYALVGDHFEVAFYGLSSGTYTNGAAVCTVQGQYNTKRGLKTIATGSFTISAL